MTIGAKLEGLAFPYAATVLLASMLIGGGTAQGLWSDHLLEILLVPSMFAAVINLDKSRFDRRAKLLLSAFLLVLLVQFLPISRSLELNSAVQLQPSIVFSPVPGRSLEAGLFGVTIAGFSLFLSRFDDLAQVRLLKFLIAGFVANLLMGMVQLSFSGTTAIEGPLPYTMKLAAFANGNHFATLALMIIPILAFYFLRKEFRIVTYGVICAFLILFMFALGSRAAMAIALLLIPFCAIWFSRRNTSTTIKSALLAASLALVVLMFLWIGGSGYFGDDGDLRAVFFATTWEAIREHWLLGTGLGSFVMIYPAYEKLDNIVGVFANHAHNDYLEFFLETGLIGLILIAGLICLLFINRSKTMFTEAAFLALLVVAVHSLVDYPLRTMAIAVPSAYLVAVVLSGGGRRRRRRID